MGLHVMAVILWTYSHSIEFVSQKKVVVAKP